MNTILPNKYNNIEGSSVVASYETGDDFIKVAFIDDTICKFSYRSAGFRHVEVMKGLAAMGSGLGKYIRENMKIRQS